MALTKVHLLPLFTFILIPSSFVITYCIAVYLKHVEVDFPYISDTGAKVPESCIFSQLINIVAVILAATMYVRYKLIEQHYRDHMSSESTKVLRINMAAILIGWFGCFGVSMLANFQETSVIVVHMIGSLIAFGCATLYSWLHVLISYYVCPLLHTRTTVWVRAALSLIVTITFGTTLILGIISRKKFHGKDPTKWRPEDGGFIEHLISSISEWVLVIAFDFYILTYTLEMKKVAVASPQIQFIVEDHELHSNEFYGSEDRVTITHSQTSLKINSAPTTPYGEYGTGESRMTTQAIIH